MQGVIYDGNPQKLFFRLFSRQKIEVKTNGCRINVSLARHGKKLDAAQDALDAQVWNDMQKYMPKRSGQLIEETGMLNGSTRGEVYLYPPESDYGHYQYEGILYVDPVYKKGAFYSKDYGFWSRPGIAKEKSDRPLFYTRDTAEAHWDEVAYANHKKDWVRAAKRGYKNAKA